MALKILEVGDRVKINSTMYQGKGAVVYIDTANFFNNDYYPIQVEMDKPDEDGHSMKRFNLNEVKPLAECV